jgi:hypothetical protein
LILENIPLEKITENDLQRLIDNEVQEGRHIEYKSNRPAIKDEEKKKFLIQVTSFANAAGGNIIYGIREENHIPKEVLGFEIDNVDEEKQRLANIIRDGVEPHIWGFNIHIILLSSGRKTIIVRIPRSYYPPHMVTFGGERRFYSRGPAGVYPLDVGDLRTLFGFADITAKSIRDFRAGRLMRIKNGEAPVPMLKGPTYLLHMIPLDAFSASLNYDLSAFDQLNGKKLPYLSGVIATYTSGRLNFEGYISYPGIGSNRPTPEKPARFYTQLFRNGIIEASYLQYNPNVEGKVEKNINPDYEKHVINGSKELLKIQEQLGVTPPIAILLSILGVKGRSIAHEDSDLWTNVPIEQDDLVLPEAIIESYEDDISKKMKPIFEIVLNAAGLKGGN